MGVREKSGIISCNGDSGRKLYFRKIMSLVLRHLNLSAGGIAQQAFESEDGKTEGGVINADLEAIIWKQQLQSVSRGLARRLEGLGRERQAPSWNPSSISKQASDPGHILEPLRASGSSQEATGMVGESGREPGQFRTPKSGTRGLLEVCAAAEVVVAIDWKWPLVKSSLVTLGTVFLWWFASPPSV